MIVSLNQFYKAIGVTKQGLHHHLNSQLEQQSLFENLHKITVQIRQDHPTLSCRAMFFKIQPEGIGRDKFERLCRQWGLVQKMTINRIRTTYSSGVIRFNNWYKDVVFTDIDQAYVSDITYFEVGDRFYYITFIMDAYSRYIIGYSVSKRLTTEQTTLAAFNMVLGYKKHKLPKGIIFHSDGGGQYYDKAFLKITSDYYFTNSMCEFAYENGKAERINGIIKNNYLKHKLINTYQELQKELDHTVSLYNKERPHKSLDYITPQEIEKRCNIARANKAENDKVIRCK
jgi:transposase InsO family protein